MLVIPTKKPFGKHKVGDSFDLPEKQASVLISRGLLRAADESGSAEISVRTGLPKRQYRRRDLRAET
jgi:hypothetical protein